MDLLSNVCHNGEHTKSKNCFLVDTIKKWIVIKIALGYLLDRIDLYAIIENGLPI
jgi:hypothetical protein